MNKKLIPILLALVWCMTIALSACSGSTGPGAADVTQEAAVTSSPSPTAANASDVPSAEPTESQEKVCFVSDFSALTSNGFMEQIYETDTSLYYLCEVANGEYMVYFSDKEYKDWMPLCFRPDCMHKNESCNARLEGNTFMRMLLYGDRIYYFTLNQTADEYLPSLWCMKLDGSDHELLYTMQYPEEDVFYSFKTWSWMFFNKYAAITFVGDDSGSEELASVKSYSYLIDLSKKSIQPEPYGYVDEEGNKRGFSTPLAGSGNIMYGMNTDENNALYRFDVTAGTAVKLCNLPIIPDGQGYWLDGDSLYLCTGWTEGKILRVDVNTGEYEVLAEAGPQEHKWYYPYRGYIFGTNPSVSGDLRGTEICSITGETLYSIPYEDYNAEIVIVYIIGDYVLAVDYEDGDEFIDAPPTWYLDVRDIGTDNLMWRRWEP